MRARVRHTVAGLIAGALTLSATPALAATTDRAVPLVVGLRREAAAVPALDRVAAVRTEDLAGAVAVDVPAGRVADAARVLAADPNVAYVERDHVAHAAAITPDDPGYPAQWGLAKARVNQAWSAIRGASRVVVAVVDTGVREMPDLAGRILPGH